MIYGCSLSCGSLILIMYYVPTYNTCCRYLDEGESNMAIVDVEIPSGYVFITYSDPSRVIERQETRGSNAIFYISAVSICYDYCQYCHDLRTCT